MSRDNTYSPIVCHTIDDFGTAWFNVTQPCNEAIEQKCLGIYLTVQVDKTNFRCLGI